VLPNGNIERGGAAPPSPSETAPPRKRWTLLESLCRDGQALQDTRLVQVVMVETAGMKPVKLIGGGGAAFAPGMHERRNPHLQSQQLQNRGDST
jgi:hypothetical protein